MTTTIDTERLLEGNRFYSGRFEELNRLLLREPAMRSQQLQIDFDYGYPLAAWPVILSAQRVAEFERFVAWLPQLYLKAIRVVFGDDAEAMARYLHVPVIAHSLVKEYGIETLQLLNRHDAVFSGGDFKLLEVNAGSNIGGWQPGMLEARFREVLAGCPHTAQWNLHHRNVLRLMFESLGNAMAALPNQRATGQLLASDAGDSYVHAELQRQLDVALRASGRFPDARLSFTHDFSDVEFDAQGRAVWQGRVQDVAMISVTEGREVQRHKVMQMTSAHLAGKLVMPDSLRHALLGNKLLMALVHEPALAPHLDAEETRLLARHIPFTMPLQSRQLQRHGRQWSLPELLRARPDDWVIKKSHSLQGRDVFVGRFCPRPQWEAVIDEHLDRGDWMAQEFCPSDLMLGPDGQGGMTAFQVIWGIFDLGGHYGGAFVRAMPVDKSTGVINSATGATEFTVFEEAARRSRVSL